ncbi:hypothetical protein BN3456_01086 [Clostridium sp. C105KSO13]|nr:hypothetical protein BN3456_01086 [Clostridium sp. C105KSO13]
MEDLLWGGEKLEQHNVSILDDHFLAEQENTQIRVQLNFVNYYEATKWIAGKTELQKYRSSGRMIINERDDKISNKAYK